MRDYEFNSLYPDFEAFSKCEVYYRRVNSDVLDGSVYRKANLTTKKAIWDASCEDDVQVYYADSLRCRQEFRDLCGLMFNPNRDDIELGSIHRCGDYIFATEDDIISDNLPFCGLS